MKTLIATATLSLCALTVSAQSVFSISGNIPGMPDSSEVVLMMTEGMNPKKLAASEIKDGRFTLTGEYKNPQLCEMKFYVPGKKIQVHVCDLRVMTDSQPLTVVADTADVLHSHYNVFTEAKTVFEGSDIQRQYMEYLDATRREEYIADSARYAQAQAWFDNHGNDEAIAGYKQRAAAAKQQLEQCADAFLMSHPDYYPTAALLAQRLYKDFTYTAEQYDSYLELLKNNPDTAHVNFIRRNINTAKEYAIGARYTDFSDKRSDGSVAALSSLMQEGKYTLIDFWASWCGPCRSAIPKVKAMAEEFKDRLQVVSVSLDKKEADWAKAEKEENMPWPQLILTGDNYNTVCNAYMINSIPRLVLIAPDGGVVVATHDPGLVRTKIQEAKRQ